MRTLLRFLLSLGVVVMVAGGLSQQSVASEYGWLGDGPIRLSLQAATEPAEESHAGTEVRVDYKKTRGERMGFLGRGFWVPALSIEADTDEAEPGLGIEFDADVKTGRGWGGWAGFANYDETGGMGLGLMYTNTRHMERTYDAPVDVHAAYLEVMGMARFGDDDFALYGEAGIGIGGVVVDFTKHFDDEGGLAGSFRLGVGLEVLHLHVGISGGVYTFGYPTETIAKGAYAMVEAGFYF